jgi:hypothetical protein
MVFLLKKMGLCAYNYARRLENKELSKQIINKMQFFYVKNINYVLLIFNDLSKRFKIFIAYILDWLR